MEDCRLDEVLCAVGADDQHVDLVFGPKSVATKAGEDAGDRVGEGQQRKGCALIRHRGCHCFHVLPSPRLTCSSTL